MDLNSQTPAQGIMLTHDFGDSKFYRISCECGQQDDEIEFSVEVEDGIVTVHTYTLQKSEYWKEVINQSDALRFDSKIPEWIQNFDYKVRGFINSIAHRLSITWNIWVHGYVKYHSYTILSKQAALNYADTLKQAVKDVNAVRRNKNKIGNSSLL